MTDGMTAFIFARGGSKGLPGKNIKPLAGKPLIAWGIEAALAVPGITRVVVSTDNADIARVACDWGRRCPLSVNRFHTMRIGMDARRALETLRDSEGALPEPFISAGHVSSLARTSLPA